MNIDNEYGFYKTQKAAQRYAEKVTKDFNNESIWEAVQLPNGWWRIEKVDA